MKYLLVVGFYCDVYRKEPKARIFLDDQLIDEFNIQHQQKKEKLTDPFNNTTHPLAPWNFKTLEEYVKQSLPSLRFYEIEINDQLKQTNIRIDIDNNDSDYANGFMRRSTLLQFRVLLLLPTDKKIYSCALQKACNQWLSYKSDNRYAWYYRDSVNKFILLNHDMIWIGNNKQKYKDTIQENIIYYKIGGSGSLHYQLIKKYGILMPKFKDSMLPYIDDICGIFPKVIYDKYEHYENQRNTV